MSKKKLIHEPKTPQQRRDDRKEKRDAPRRLLNGVNGEDIGEAARALIRRCANTHVPQETRCEAAFQRIVSKATKLTGLMQDRQVGVAFSAELFIILDSYFPACRVGVEIDGPEHSRPCAKLKDEWRDGLLKKKDVHVIRFSNRMVTDRPNDVLVQLVEFLSRHARGRAKELIQKRLSPSWRTEVSGGESTADGTVA